MKLLFAFLLAINALLFSMAAGWVTLWDPRDPERVRRQVDAERVTVLSMQASAPPAAPATAQSGPQSATGLEANTGASPSQGSGSDATPGVAGPTAAATATAATGAPAAAGVACLEFPPMPSERAEKVEANLKQAGIAVEVKTPGNEPSFIVYLVPSESTKEAQRKLAELRKLGVIDAFIIPEGPVKNGISLGLFRAEDGARALSKDLSGKGVKNAKVARSNVLRGAPVTLTVSGADAQLIRVRQAAAEAKMEVKACGT